MLRAILNKCWKQHPTKQQPYGHLPLITKTIKISGTRHAGHCWRSRDELVSDVRLWSPSHGQANAGRTARTNIEQLCGDTGYRPEDPPKQWTIGGGGERRSNISVLMAWHHDDDDSFCFMISESSVLNPFDLHHHHVVSPAWISLPLSRHFSLSFIASGRSSGLHPYPHRAAVCMFELVFLLLPGHVWGSIGVHHLWARPCFSSSVRHV